MSTCPVRMPQPHLPFSSPTKLECSFQARFQLMKTIVNLKAPRLDPIEKFVQLGLALIYFLQ